MLSQRFLTQAKLPIVLKKRKTLLVGTEGTYAPFTFHDKSGKLTGFDVEVIRKVAEKLGLKVEFKETQWDAMYAGLNAKRFDVIANQTNPSPERLKNTVSQRLIIILVG